MLQVLQQTVEAPFIPRQTSTSLTAEGSPVLILELFEAEAPRTRPSALYAVEAWQVPVPWRIISSSPPSGIEACMAAAAGLALEAQRVRTSWFSCIEADKTRAVIPLAPEAGIVPFPRELFPSSLAFYIEADKAQTSVRFAVEADQEQTSAPFYIEADRTRPSVPFAVEAQDAPLSWRLSSVEAWEVPSSLGQLQASVLHAVESWQAQALVQVSHHPSHRPSSPQREPGFYAQGV